MKSLTNTLIVMAFWLIADIAYSLPPSISALNIIADSLEKHLQVENIHIDIENNIFGYFGRYDKEAVMNVYGFQIDSDGEVIEEPHLLFSQRGPFTGLNVIGDNYGNLHMVINVFSENEWDGYFKLDRAGNRLHSVWPNCRLSCRNILSDSIFISFRIAYDYEFEWIEDNVVNDMFYKFNFKNPADSAFTHVQIPFIELGCYAPILEITPENEVLIILSNYETTGYYDFKYPTKFASFIADLDGQELSKINKGDIGENASYIYDPINLNIGIDGTSTIWLGDSLLFYSRMSTNREEDSGTSDSLYVIIFDKDGNILKSDEKTHLKITYKSIDTIGTTEKLITYWVVRSGKYKFGLISFADFPNIYLDFGEK